MRKVVLIPMLLLLFIATVLGNPPEPSWQLPTTDVCAKALEGLEFRAFVDELIRRWLLAMPLHMTIYGLADELGVRNDRLYFRERERADYFRQLGELALEELERLGPETTSMADLLSYSLIVVHAESLVEPLDEADSLFDWPHSFVSYLYSYLGYYLPVGTEEQLQDYISCLWDLGGVAEELILGPILANRDAGIVPTKHVLDSLIDWAAALAGRSGPARLHAFYGIGKSRLRRSVIPNPDDKDRYLQQMEEAIDGAVKPIFDRIYEELLLIEAQTSPLSSDDWIGHDLWPSRYRSGFEAEVTALRTVEEIHQRALEEIGRLSAEIIALGDEIGATAGSVAETIAIARSEFIWFSEVEEIFTHLYEASLQSASSVFARLPSIPMEPAVESGRYAAAYRLAPIGAADPLSATFLLPSGLTDHYTFETYLYHEAIPGHHLQLGLTRELDLPLIQKLGWWTSFKEGWATYAQTLAYELGLYSDPLSRIGYFAELLHTAARTALETGYLAGVWSREEARAFTEEYFGWFGYDTDYVDRSTDQLVHDPYRLTTYFVGWITFLDERQRAMNVLGEAFDLAEFHDAVLRHGTVPLDTLTTIVDRYIIETFFGFNRISEPEIAP